MLSFSASMYIATLYFVVKLYHETTKLWEPGLQANSDIDAFDRVKLKGSLLYTVRLPKYIVDPPLQ